MYKPLLAAFLLVSLPLSYARALTPNDSFFDDQWYLGRIFAEDAWETTTGNPDLIIAVLDTGVDLDHPDLSGNIWTNPEEVAGNNLDDDRNGFIDDVHGWDFVDDDAEAEPVEVAEFENDSASHGTLIAGMIGATTNNSFGYAGLVWDVQIMPVRMLNAAGAGTESAAAEAVDYAVANGAQVINMSFAGPSAGTRLTTAVREAYEAGVVVVAALGNDGENVNEDPVYPACLQSIVADWVIGVTATDETDAETDFTNYGDECADLSAPGVNILGLGYQEFNSDSAYSGPWDGTSAASPLVAGTAGLLLSAYPDLTPEQIFAILKLSVDPIRDTISGAGSLGVGRLNVARALEVGASFATGTSVVPDSETSFSGSPLTGGEKSSSGEDDNAHASFIALGAPAGVAPDVSVYRADGTPYAVFAAYAPNFQGGIRVALEDLDGDVIPEVVTGAGPGGGPHVRVFKPYGAIVSEFFAYDKASDKGVNVAIGDVDADGYSDIVTAVGAGVSNDVVVWSAQGIEKSRFTVTGFAEGAPLAVAVADVDDDWEKEIVVFSDTGESRVAIYNIDGSRVVDFIAFPGSPGGTRVDVADFDGDYRDEIVTVGGIGSDTQVRIYNKIGAYWGGFALSQTVGIDLNVSVTDIDVDGEADIVLAPRNGAGEVQYFTPMGELIDGIGSGLVNVPGAYLAAW
jgi:subtilisin family serine protease